MLTTRSSIALRSAGKTAFLVAAQQQLQQTTPSILVASRLHLCSNQHASTSASLGRRAFHSSPSILQEQQKVQNQSSSQDSAVSSPVTSRVSEAVLSDKSEPGWALKHSHYQNEEELENVKVVHHTPERFGDHVAKLMVGVMRFGFDVATRYPKHRQRFPRVKGSGDNLVKVGLPKIEEKMGAVQKSKEDALPEEMSLSEMRRRHLSFGPEQWLIRIVFLESIAGVPGMVAAACRHLHSLRLLRRDKGWIHTMIEDAANERQHLLVALKLYQPGVFMRTMLLFAQGIFYNFFFLFYLVAPRVAHRFVGVLEEEAVYTYSRIVDDIRSGRLPEWENYQAPSIAIDYWGLQKDAKIVDVMRAIRSDEANHRYINHTLASLKSDDFNPFAFGDAPPLERGRTWGMTRDEAISYFEHEDAKRRGISVSDSRKERQAEQAREEREDGSGSGAKKGKEPFAGTSSGTSA